MQLGPVAPVVTGAVPPGAGGAGRAGGTGAAVGNGWKERVLLPRHWGCHEGGSV